MQQGAGLGSIFSGLIRTLAPAAKSAVKSIGRFVKSDGVKSAGRYLKKEATTAAVDTALEALEGRPDRGQKSIKDRDQKHTIKQETGRHGQVEQVAKGKTKILEITGC